MYLSGKHFTYYFQEILLFQAPYTIRYTDQTDYDVASKFMQLASSMPLDTDTDGVRLDNDSL